MVIVRGFDRNINKTVPLQHKHPLQNTWTLWYDDPQMAKATPGMSWEANLKNIATFDTVEDFWG